MPYPLPASSGHQLDWPDDDAGCLPQRMDGVGGLLQRRGVQSLAERVLRLRGGRH